MQLKKALLLDGCIQYPSRSSKPPPACLLLPLFLKNISVSSFLATLFFGSQLSGHHILLSQLLPSFLTALLCLFKIIRPNDHRELLAPFAEGKITLLLCCGLFVCLFSHYYPESLMENCGGSSQQRWGYSISKLTRSAHQFVSHS